MSRLIREGSGRGGGRGARREAVTNLAGPGADRRPVAEVPLWRLDRPGGEALHEAEVLLVQLADEDLVAPCPDLGEDGLGIDRVILRDRVVPAERSAAEQPDDFLSQ